MSIKELPVSPQLADFYISKAQRFSCVAFKRKAEGQVVAYQHLMSISDRYMKKANLVLS